MAIAWSSPAGRECMEGVKRDIRALSDRIEAAIERGKQPCAKAANGEHRWHRRPSAVLPGRGWDECERCQAERFD